MKIPLFYFIAFTFLVGCNLTQDKIEDVDVQQEIVTKSSAHDSNIYSQRYSALLDEKNSLANRYKNSKTTNNRTVNHYARGLTQELIGNLKYVNTTTPIAITNFVFIEQQYNNSNLLGHQLSESFMHEFHKFGIPIIDFKTTDFIRVTPGGDFILSRDFIELTPGLPIQYVVVGTFAKQNNGYLVNARIVGVKSKAIVATAQSFIPEYVISSLNHSSKKPAVKLTQG